MDLYDPDRARGPLSVRRGKGATVASSWTAIGADVVARLKAAGSEGRAAHRPHRQPRARRRDCRASRRAPACGTSRGRRSRTTRPVWRGSRRSATRSVARPRLDAANLIVGLGAEFLDRPDEGFEREFAAAPRRPDQADRPADEPVRPARGPADADRRECRPAHPGARLAPRGVAAALATNWWSCGRSARSPRFRRSAPRSRRSRIDAVAKQAGIDAAVLKSLADELAAARREGAGRRRRPRRRVSVRARAGARSHPPEHDGRRVRRRPVRRGGRDRARRRAGRAALAALAADMAAGRRGRARSWPA